MSYNILAINPGHNGSAALVSDGVLQYYIEEERLSRMKYDGNPFRGMLEAITNMPINELIIAGTGQEEHKLPWTGENSYTALVRKFNPNVKVTHIGNEHHLGHAAAAFYNSGFEEAVAIVVDGAGSLHKRKPDPENQPDWEVQGYEAESVLVCKYPAQFETVYKNYGHNEQNRTNLNGMVFDNAVTITKAYEAVSQYLGFGFIEAGKTMGLAPYGKEDKNIPPLFFGGRGSKDVFIPSYPAGALIDQARIPSLQQTDDPKAWHTDQTKLPEISKNLAFAIQRDTQEQILHLILQAVEVTGIKNVVLAGGYGLNCVANYHYQKALKGKDINLYVDPVAHDGGTAIGAAKMFHYLHTESTDIMPQTTLYYGTPINLDYISEVISSEDDLEVTDVEYSDVAQLIADRNIVSMFQGRSEAGPRALGNRSILYDPTDPDGKDTVNLVKGREWFRPFAGSVMLDDANDWFDLAGLEETPYMMYAVDVMFDKKDKIPAVTHVDGTCRIQTVTEEQNKHYYNLISAFKDIKEVPLLFNTSFNLAGDPLVETIEDALDTLRRSKLEYLYLPELGKLVKCETYIEPVVEPDANEPDDAPEESSEMDEEATS